VRHRVLVVDDEPDITALVAYHLLKAGYEVATANTGQEGLKKALEEVPEVVVLDLMLPGVSGLEVLRELRKREATREVGVILLTARREEADRIKGLSLGADDYLTKPFSPVELTLRVGAVVRRLGAPAGILSEGPLSIDRAARRVSVEGKDVPLTATEYKLLLTLVERKGRLQTRADLLQTVWDAQPDIQTRTVDMHVQRLRSKLGPAEKLIETRRGSVHDSGGYRFNPGPGRTE
jgi:two-component system phosphate regulon response regulator PhoB